MWNIERSTYKDAVKGLRVMGGSQRASFLHVAFQIPKLPQPHALYVDDIV